MSTTLSSEALLSPASGDAPAGTRSWSTPERTRSLTAPPSSLPPFWLVCALTLIVAHYQVWQRFNVGYKVLGVVVVLMMPLTAGFMRMLTRPAVLWLLLFEAVMVGNMLLGRYLPGEMYSTASHPIQLIRALPLMLCGYTIAKYPTSQKRFFFIVTFVYVLFSAIEVRGFVQGAGQGLGRAEQYTQTFGLDDSRVGAGYVGAFVYFAPLLLFLAIALMRLYPVVSGHTRVAILVAQATFALVGLFSGFGAMLMIFLVAVALVTIVAPVRTLGQRVAFTGLGVIGLLAFEYLRAFFTSEIGRGGVFSAFWKITTIVSAVFARQADDSSLMMELGSSSRWSLILRSFETFCDNLLVGHGLLDNSDFAVGRHSYFFDTAATFGLVGLIPVIAFFVILMRGLLRARRGLPSSWEITSSLVFLGTFIAGNVINPYFMGMLSLTYFEFLILGFCLADCERVSGGAMAKARSSGMRTAGWHHVA